jgi:hypothetical protein
VFFFSFSPEPFVKQLKTVTVMVVTQSAHHSVEKSSFHSNVEEPLEKKNNYAKVTSKRHFFTVVNMKRLLPLSQKKLSI